MCSNFDDNLHVCMDNVTVSAKIKPFCRKCLTEKSSVLLQKKFAYCRLCFLGSITHKFRAAVGKQKLKHESDRVLLVFNGDLTSNALLHLFQKGMDECNNKRFKFSISVIYIDETSLWPDHEDKAAKADNVTNTLIKNNFSAYFTKLSSAYNDSISIIDFNENFSLKNFEPDDNDKKMRDFFNGTKDMSSKVELLYLLRYRMYLEIAVKLNCNQVCLPDCATDIAINVINDTITGRSPRIPHNAAICEFAEKGITFLKPLHEVTRKELSYYHVFNNMELGQYFSYEPFKDRPSLQLETSMFILGLENNFPSTVYTVFRIGQKLNKKEKNNESTGRCALCYVQTEITDHLISTNPRLCDICFNTIGGETQLTFFPQLLMNNVNI